MALSNCYSRSGIASHRRSTRPISQTCMLRIAAKSTSTITPASVPRIVRAISAYSDSSDSSDPDLLQLPHQPNLLLHPAPIASKPFTNQPTSRRSVMLRGLALAAATTVTCSTLTAADGPLGRPPAAAALPLGPLGPVTRVGGDKRIGLRVEEVAAVLRRDLAEGQYFVTGDLTREVFADDCRFVDPTNDVTGLSKYLTALKVLFDPAYSKVEGAVVGARSSRCCPGSLVQVELLDIHVTGPRQVEADWRLGGYLVFPWNPRVEPFEGHTVYALDDQGLVIEQRQTWSISAATALRESFTPTWGPRRQLF